MLRKGVYAYEYMDDREKFNTWTLEHLNVEHISDADYAHAKGVWNEKFRRIPWFVCSKQYIIVSWCIWELLKYLEVVLLWVFCFLNSAHFGNNISYRVQIFPKFG